MSRGRLDRSQVIGAGTGPPPADAYDVFYLRELELQCEFALRALDEIKQRIAQGSRDHAILAFAHMFLVFAANASKLLFSERGASAISTTRASRLRDLLSVTDEPMPRTARNYLEHFDERLDQFLRHRPTRAGIVIHRLVVDTPPTEVQVDEGRAFKPWFLQFWTVSSSHAGLRCSRPTFSPLFEA